VDELIVRVARALACLTRLQILSRLARQRQVAPSALGRDLGIGLDTVCVHLRRLCDAGLIQRRRSGRWCYGVGESPYREDTLSGKVTRWIRRLLADPLRSINDYGVEQLRNHSSQQAEALIHRLLFEALTAFTNVRRLKILRRLANGKDVAAETLMKELHMSDAAVSRHMNKLVRRGYVQSARRGRRFAYRLSNDYRSALHKELYDIVASNWRKK
jgi:DNA-binding transcriptional ArsR family regulator